MVDGPIFRKTSAPHSFMTNYRMNLHSARSISLDSTFKTLQYLPWDRKSWDKHLIIKVKIQNTLPV